MQIHLSEDGVPLYQQIVDQLRQRIVSGQLAVGDELPAIRKFAAMLRVNPNTIARAYRELEHAQLVEKRRTRGTFVTGVASTMSSAKRRGMVQPQIDQLVSLSRALGIDDDDLVDWIRACLQTSSTNEVPE